jgi:peptide chain release factor 1
MFDKLTAVEQRYDELLQLLSSAQVQNDPSEYRKHAKAASEVEPLVERFREYRASSGTLPRLRNWRPRAIPTCRNWPAKRSRR